MTSANGAPLKSRRQDSPPMWVNPCGLASEDFTIDPDVEQLNDYELISQIILQTQTALSHTLLFKDAFVSIIYYMNITHTHTHTHTHTQSHTHTYNI
ncbi:hypothetical protein M0802_016583 [Mischocyttarus mexicanus]|nr:hypothetical protein M0802_016583 [Mischocyttarus mexicanus]